MSEYFLVFDPGKTTGLLVMNRVTRCVGTDDYKVILSDEIQWPNRFERIFDLYEKYYHLYPVTIIEDFRLFDRGKVNRSNEMPSSQVIGAVQMAMYCHALEPATAIFYPPNVKSDRNLLRTHLRDIKPSSAHCLDAYKLWVYHATKRLGFAPSTDLCYNGYINRSITRKVAKEL